jgi:ribonuclease HI
MPTNSWKVYSDGGCAPSNPGPAGWGAVIVAPHGAQIERFGFIGPGTNQIAELTAAIEGLSETPEGSSVELVSDSQYVLKGISEWREGWVRRGYRNAQGSPIANLELWQTLFELVDDRRVTVQWVRGHTGHPENERADELATYAISSKSSN